jgi:eukaryotic-like serine/threonine-protein kinase
VNRPMTAAHANSSGNGHHLEDVLAAYLEAVEAGRAPDRDELLARHPELADELASFFANRDRIAGLAAPLRPGPDADLPTTPHSPDFEPEAVPPPGTSVRYFGDYELIRELARGGMGVVYKARQVSLNRFIALKMILAGRFASEADVQRFRLEAESAARLDHPNIVPIYEVGEHQGQHYFTMKLVDGGSLAREVPRLVGDPRASARLVATVARAVHYAHQRGILHRDLKPANVLLDERGEPHVTDFGLAKRVEGDPRLTRSGAILGTPGYMAPEQAAGRATGVTTAADIYALGAILYELLTGRPPFRAESALETLRQVREDAPAPPRSLNPAADRDLETIGLKCLEKSPQGRYGSAEALADDLERWLQGRPILARPSRPWERALKWSRRHPARAALLLVGAVAALATAGALWGFRSAARLAEAVSTLRAEHRDVVLKQKAAKQRLEQTELARRRAEAAVAERERVITERDAELAHRNIAKAEWAWRVGEVEEADRLLEACRRGLRCWEWHYLKRLCHAERLVLRGHEGGALAAAYSPDGALLATAGADRVVRVWDAATGREVHALRGHAGAVYALAYRGDGRRLASAGADGVVKVWEAATGRPLLTLRGHDGWVGGVAFAPDGRALASAGADGTVRTWDAATGTPLLRLGGHSGAAFAVAYSPDGRRLASADEGGVVRTWDAATGGAERSFEGHARAVRCLAFSPDGTRLASAGADRIVRVWDVDGGREVKALRGSTGLIAALAFGPNGRRLASAGDDRIVRVWDAVEGHELFALPGTTGPVAGVAFRPDGGRIAAAGQDGAVRVWDAEGAECRVLRGETWWAGCLAFSPDGTRLAAGGAERGDVQLWEAATGRPLPALDGPDVRINGLAFGPDHRLAAVADDRTVRVWDLARGRPPLVLRDGGREFAGLAFSPDGTRLAAGAGHTVAVRIVFEGKQPDWNDLDRARDVVIWDAAAGRRLHTLRGHRGSIPSVAFSPDGKRLASAGADGSVRVWDAATGDEVRRLRGHVRGAFAVAFSPDGRRLVSGGADGVVRLWDAANGLELHALRGHTGWVTGVAFGDGGRRVASSSFDQTVRIWDPEAGREVLALRGHADRVLGVAFSPDGRRLASVGTDRTVRLWDAGPAADRDEDPPSEGR